MSEYEIALLVLVALVLCLVVYDIIKVRGRLRDLEYGEKWLKNQMRHQAEVHQAVMDRHTNDIKQLNEAHEKFAQRVQYFMNQAPAYSSLAGKMDRLLKAQATRELYVDGKMNKQFEGELPPGTEEPF